VDFCFSDEQEAVGQAASQLFDGQVPAERVAAVEAEPDRVDRPLWSGLAAADLLGLAIPEHLGGAGLGLTEVCLVLQAQGRRVAPVPLWATLLLGAWPLARHGSEELQRRWLPSVAAGETFLSGALADATDVTTPPEEPRFAVPVRAESVGGGAWRLHGMARAVPFGNVAARIVVPASTVDGELVVALVDPSADGATLEPAETTNRELHPHLHLDGAVVEGSDVLGTGVVAGRLLRDQLGAARTGLCALQVGVAGSALEQTADYLNQRHQFGRPLSTFQATKLRAADAYIDLEAMRVTLWQAAWRIDTGRSADEAVATAAWHASERGQRVVHATQHLHGGIGADTSYPIHRYFLWGKQLELMLGSPSVHLAALGRMVAERARGGAGTTAGEAGATAATAAAAGTTAAARAGGAP
jgi:3-oxocholest-4-en-26-oyl-CoA dehydrogenase beta subunit